MGCSTVALIRVILLNMSAAVRKPMVAVTPTAAAVCTAAHCMRQVVDKHHRVLPPACSCVCVLRIFLRFADHGLTELLSAVSITWRRDLAYGEVRPDVEMIHMVEVCCALLYVPRLARLRSA